MSSSNVKISISTITPTQSRRVKIFLDARTDMTLDEIIKASHSNATIIINNACDRLAKSDTLPTITENDRRVNLYANPPRIFPIRASISTHTYWALQNIAGLCDIPLPKLIYTALRDYLSALKEGHHHGQN